MKRWWTLALLAGLVLLSGCGYDPSAERRTQLEQARFMSGQPFLNGSNGGWAVFVAGVTTVLVIGAVCWALATIRVAKHKSRARIREAEESTRRAEIAAGKLFS